jgi:hypothetical protein
MGKGKDLKPRKAAREGAFVENRGSKPMKPIEDSQTKMFINSLIDTIEKDADEFLPEFFDKTSGEKRMTKTSPREMLDKGLGFFRSCLELNQPFTMSGLAIKTGIASYTLRNLEHSAESGQFKYVIQKLRSLAEMYNEASLHLRQNPVGSIFVLKNMGWKDNVDVNIRPILPMTDEERQQAKLRIKSFSE